MLKLNKNCNKHTNISNNQLPFTMRKQTAQKPDNTGSPQYLNINRSNSLSNQNASTTQI